MSRAVLCLALFAALFLAAGRCLGGFGGFGASTAHACSEPSRSQDHDVPLTPLALDDDADDASDPLLPPVALIVTPVAGFVGPCRQLAAFLSPALFSAHPRSLERPPRA